MDKVLKIVVVTVILFAFILIPQVSFASSHTHSSLLDGGSGGAKPSIDYDNIETWNFSIAGSMPAKVLDIVAMILKILRNISIILTVLVITILGIKYMVGSVEQKAEYKKGYINIIIGVVLISTITSIVSFIFSAI